MAAKKKAKNKASKKPEPKGRLVVEYVSIDSLKPWAKNPRLNDETVDSIVKSIEKFGYTNPVLVRRADNRIIAGHTRVKALTKIGETVAPVIFMDIGETDADLYALFDNKSTENTAWDPPKLSELFVDLKEMGADIEFTGFSFDEISEYIDGGIVSGPADDLVPEPPKIPKTKTGDLYTLGEHKLLCGDSTKTEDVERLLSGEMVDCVFTSPPYAVGIDYGTYKDTIDNLRNMLPLQSKVWKDVVVGGGFAVVNFGDIASGKELAGSDTPCEYPMALEYWPIFRGDGWALWSRRVWCKPNPRVHSLQCIQSNRAATDYEHIWTWKKDGDAIVKRVDGLSCNGWFDTTHNTGVEVGKEIHGAGMATSCAERMIKIHSRNESNIYEPFAGTGTTLIAAEKLNRKCFGMEIDPVYCDVIVQRWEDFSGKKAERVRNT